MIGFGVISTAGSMVVIIRHNPAVSGSSEMPDAEGKITNSNASSSENLRQMIRNKSGLRVSINQPRI